jgi:hypothetical protein
MRRLRLAGNFYLTEQALAGVLDAMPLLQARDGGGIAGVVTRRA